MSGFKPRDGNVRRFVNDLRDADAVVLIKVLVDLGFASTEVTLEDEARGRERPRSVRGT